MIHNFFKYNCLQIFLKNLQAAAKESTPNFNLDKSWNIVRELGLLISGSNRIETVMVLEFISGRENTVVSVKLLVFERLEIVEFVVFCKILEEKYLVVSS